MEFKYVDEVEAGDRIRIPGLVGGPEGLLVEDATSDDTGTTITVWMPEPNAAHMMEIVLNPEIQIGVTR